MRLDMLATEPHFIDHLAPVWHALPEDLRGRFATTKPLQAHAVARGIQPEQLGHSDAVLVASYGDQKRARTAGRPSIARLEHGAGQSYLGLNAGNYAGGRDCDDVSLFLCPNEHAADRWRSAYPGAQVDVVGCPKLDTSERVAGGEPTIAISFHFDCNLVPETKSAFPHFRRALPALARLQPAVKVIGHAHPRAFDAVAPHYRRAGIEPVRSFDDVLERADVYACDNSSTLFEFAATGRPVVVLNAPWYRRDVRHGGRFWDWATVGLQVDDPDRLVATLLLAVADRRELRRRREHIVDHVYPIREGSAALAAASLARWLGVREERRAA